MAELIVLGTDNFDKVYKGGASGGIILRLEKSALWLNPGPGAFAKLEKYIDLKILDTILVNENDLTKYNDINIIKEALNTVSNRTPLLMGPKTLFPNSEIKKLRNKEFIIEPFEFKDALAFKVITKEFIVSFLPKRKILKTNYQLFANSDIIYMELSTLKSTIDLDIDDVKEIGKELKPKLLLLGGESQLIQKPIEIVRDITRDTKIHAEWTKPLKVIDLELYKRTNKQELLSFFD